ncbi:MAG: molybdopterin-dependent oxidoreductase [Candidatus Kapabacteria bacterium]|jgi:hypothetical protein|nr:molybdopterin-dependent oxidoreductase [Candidatus Kapabacteria bacterium]
MTTQHFSFRTFTTKRVFMTLTSAITVLLFWSVIRPHEGFARQDSLARFIAKTLFVRGKVSTPLQISLADLRSFKQYTVTKVPIVSYSGEKKETIGTAKGVLIRDVLEKAGIVFEGKRDFNSIIIKATATDGFTTLFSWHEIFNSETGNHIYIITEKDGKPLASKEADFMLLSAKDIKTGPRHVRWLQVIEVIKL